MEEDNRTLYISNLDKNVSEEILYELFLQAGPIEKVFIQRGRKEPFRFGCVTYKHESSVDYAINLFKGTALFRKELSIRKSCAKSTNDQQSEEFGKFDILDSSSGRQDFFDYQEQLHNLQLLAQNFNNFQRVTNFISNGFGRNWSNRNRPHDFKIKNNFSRAKGGRNRQKMRDHGGKMYHRRKNRQRE